MIQCSYLERLDMDEVDILCTSSGDVYNVHDRNFWNGKRHFNSIGLLYRFLKRDENIGMKKSTFTNTDTYLYLFVLSTSKSKILQMWKKDEPKEGAIYLPRRWPSLAQMYQCHLCDIDVVFVYVTFGERPCKSNHCKCIKYMGTSSWNNNRVGFIRGGG